MRTRFNDLTGKAFGHWTVLALSSHVGPTGALYWGARCACGTEKLIRGTALSAGTTKSCGCRSGDLISASRTTHGKSRDPVYYIWMSMLARCRNPNNTAFRNYGGRGIKVDPKWESFEAFYADMGDPPDPSFELDRRDNNLGYSSENCRWVSRKVNLRNRRNTRWVEVQGRKVSLAEAAELTGLSSSVIADRLNRGLVEPKLFQKLREKS